ncbi:hypothetical protein ACTFIU_004872 [Dictyostelium citrinum]
MIRQVYYKKTFPIINYYSKCFFATSNNGINSGGNINIKNNDNIKVKNEISTDNNNNNSLKNEEENNENIKKIDNKNNDNEKNFFLNINKINNNNYENNFKKTESVKKEIIAMFEEDLYENDRQRESILKSAEFPGKLSKDWSDSVLNYSPYIRMIGVNNKIPMISNTLEKYLLQKPQEYRYSYLLDCDDWIDKAMIEQQVQSQLINFFKVLNQRNQLELKEITSTWLFKILSTCSTHLSEYDQLNVNYHFNITKFISIQRGLVQRSGDKIFITFHFIFNGDLGVNEHIYTGINNFKTSIIFESLVPESHQSTDFRWKLCFLNPSTIAMLSVESIVPLFLK